MCLYECCACARCASLVGVIRRAGQTAFLAGGIVCGGSGAAFVPGVARLLLGPGEADGGLGAVL